MVQPINGDPFIGHLETPVTSAPIVASALWPGAGGSCTGGTAISQLCSDSLFCVPACLTAAGFLSNLPAYRTGVNPLLRGVEIGLTHGTSAGQLGREGGDSQDGPAQQGGRGRGLGA